MPNPRCLNSIQSPTHGLILFCPVDDNLTRIGYVFSPALQNKWGVEGMDQVLGPVGTHGDGGPLNKDILIAEAKEAVKPFKLDFKRVDWHTIYVSRISNETPTSRWGS
jgi:phenol 2-monooxygenase